jgi:fatty-acid desaturase
MSYISFLAIPLLLFYFYEINWILLYLSYFVFYGLGIEVGYHRILCHSSSSKFNYSQFFLIYIGYLTHMGSFKECLCIHTNHHAFSDTEYDFYKTYKNAVSPNTEHVNFKKRHLVHKIKRMYAENSILKLLDKNYYFFFIPTHLILFLFLGYKNYAFYIFIPCSLALLFQRYSGLVYHNFGYRNHPLPDTSKNTLLAFPFAFGGNWHNNHHADPLNPNMKHKWWELDPLNFFVKILKF